MLAMLILSTSIHLMHNTLCCWRFVPSLEKKTGRPLPPKITLHVSCGGVRPRASIIILGALFVHFCIACMDLFAPPTMYASVWTHEFGICPLKT